MSKNPSNETNITFGSALLTIPLNNYTIEDQAKIEKQFYENIYFF